MYTKLKKPKHSEIGLLNLTVSSLHCIFRSTCEFETMYMYFYKKRANYDLSKTNIT